LRPPSWRSSVSGPAAAPRRTGLEKALADKGIDADVSYDPDSSVDGNTVTVTVPDGFGGPAPEGGTLPAPEGGATVTEGGGQDSGPTTSHGPGAPPQDDPCGLGDSRQAPATLAHEGQDWVLRIPAGSPLLDDRHLAIGTTVDGMLSVIFAGDQPGTFCGVASMGAPSS
jgi:hypothetical protein